MRSNDRHPFDDAEDVHGGPDSPRAPLIDRLRQPGPLHRRGTEGYRSNKKFDPQRERRLQSLADGIGANERARDRLQPNRRRTGKDPGAARRRRRRFQGCGHRRSRCPHPFGISLDRASGDARSRPCATGCGASCDGRCSRGRENRCGGAVASLRSHLLRCASAEPCSSQSQPWPCSGGAARGRAPDVPETDSPATRRSSRVAPGLQRGGG